VDAKKSLIEEPKSPQPTPTPTPEVPLAAAPAPAAASIPQEAAVEAPKLSPLRPTFSIPSSLGQTKKLGETRVEEEVPQVAEQVEEPIYTATTAAQEISLTQELLDQAIFSIQEVFRTANRNLELTLLDQEIKVQNGEITLQVSGSIQEDIAQKMKPELMGLIRKFTGATSLKISVVQKEEVPDEKGKLYTSTDKLKFLREKHPALMELQRKFDLDVDF